MKLHKSVRDYMARHAGLGAVADDILPAFLQALPDEFRFMGIRAQIRQHLTRASLYATAAEHDSSVEQAVNDLVRAALLMRKHVTEDPEVNRKTLARMHPADILKLVYSRERRPELYEDDQPN